MNVLERIDSLQLDDDFVFDQEIESVFANLVVTIEEWN